MPWEYKEYSCNHTDVLEPVLVKTVVLATGVSLVFEHWLKDEEQDPERLGFEKETAELLCSYAYKVDRGKLPKWYWFCLRTTAQITVKGADFGPRSEPEWLGACSYESLEALVDDQLAQQERQVLKQMRETLADALEQAQTLVTHGAEALDRVAAMLKR